MVTQQTPNIGLLWVPSRASININLDHIRWRRSPRYQPKGFRDKVLLNMLEVQKAIRNHSINVLQLTTSCDKLIVHYFFTPSATNNPISHNKSDVPLLCHALFPLEESHVNKTKFKKEGLLFVSTNQLHIVIAQVQSLNTCSTPFSFLALHQSQRLEKFKPWYCLRSFISNLILLASHTNVYTL